jgi:Putative DNA-binding domain
MSKLADIQAEMQRHVQGKSASGISFIAEPPQGTKEDRLAVYRSAYGLRLAEFLANDYEKLKTYLGDVRFREMADCYRAAHPSDHPNARWYSRHLPEFLATAPSYRRHPEVAELAELERALNDAFDGPDAAICTLADMAAIDPASFGDAIFVIAPTVHRFSVTTNVTSLWSSLKCGETPPAAEDAASKIEILVWRQSSGSRFRILGDEEAMAIDCARQGLGFGVICEMIAAFDDPGGAPLRAAGYLRGWLEAEIISCIRTAGDTAK